MNSSTNNTSNVYGGGNSSRNDYGSHFNAESFMRGRSETGCRMVIADKLSSKYD